MKVGTDGVLLGAALTLPSDAGHLLDIGTGTGCVALMAAQRLSGRENYSIDAIDIDGPSAEEAAANFAASPWAQHLAAHHQSLKDFEPEADKYDAIFSNPPFFEDSLRNPDDRKAAARHTGGLSYREIFDFAADHLNANGTVSLILPAEVERDLVRCAASFGLYPFRLLRIRTTARKPFRRILAEFTTTRPVAIKEEELILQDGSSRTPAFQKLVEDFLL